MRQRWLGDKRRKIAIVLVVFVQGGVGVGVGEILIIKPVGLGEEMFLSGNSINLFF